MLAEADIDIRTMAGPLVEASLALGAGIGIGIQLARTGAMTEAIALLCMCCLTFALSMGSQASEKSRVPMRRLSVRPDASDGLALGGAMPSIVAASVLVIRDQSHGPVQLSLWVTLSCATQLVTMTCGLPDGIAAVLGSALGWVAFGPAAALIAAVTTLCHAACLFGALRLAPRSFTIGEATAVSQGVIVLLVDACVTSACVIGGGGWGELCTARSEPALFSEAVLTGGLLLVCAIGLAFAFVPARSPSRAAPHADSARSRQTTFALGLLLGGVSVLAWLRLLLGHEPLLWLLRFLAAPRRLAMLAYWAVAVTGVTALAAASAPSAPSAPAAGRAAGPRVEDSRAEDGAASSRRAHLLFTRKLFHFLVVALFVPPACTQPDLLQIAISAALAMFALLEAVRLARVPPLAAPLGAFLARFLDARDGGTLVLTHVYLLLGTGLPLLLGGASATPSAGSEPRGGAAVSSGSAVAPGLLAGTAAPFAGVAVLGVGDAFASIVGVRFGRRRWPGTRKTVEGTGAAVVAMLLLLLAVLPSDVTLGASASEWLLLLASTVATCMLEAFTEQIDNLFLPLFYYALLAAVSRSSRIEP